MKLNPDLNFQTLIPTSGNRAALEASMEFATSEDPRSNLLLLHGPPSVGKTHLLQAIHSAVSNLQPKLQVFLITCETWINELLTAIQSKRTDEFREKYHRIDMLLMDDVQVLTGRTITQQALADCITSLLLEGSRVALGHSGRLSVIPNLVRADATNAAGQKRLVLEISPPTTEKMASIVLRKVGSKYPNISSDLVSAACTNAFGDVRRAEGRLNSILLQRKFSGYTCAAPAVRQPFGNNQF